jgi:hypothetical protein
MAGDAVTNRVLFDQDGPRVQVLLTNVSDGTGENAAAKIDLSTLKDPRGEVPKALAIESVRWTISGFQWVKLAFAHTAPDTALVLGNGYGKFCFRDVGGIPDPGSAGGTGDITLTTGPVMGAGVLGTYSISLMVRKL